MSARTEHVTDLLNQWANGDQVAGEKVFPLVYPELRRIASRSMNRQGAAHTLQTTALVHEAYVRLTGDTAKRGGYCKPLPLDEVFPIAEERLTEVVLRDDALTALAKLHPRQSQVVELRFFGGLNVEQTSETLQISPETVARDWRAAKAWLHCELTRSGAGEYQNDA